VKNYICLKLIKFLYWSRGIVENASPRSVMYGAYTFILFVFALGFTLGLIVS